MDTSVVIRLAAPTLVGLLCACAGLSGAGLHKRDTGAESDAARVFVLRTDHIASGPALDAYRMFLNAGDEGRAADSGLVLIQADSRGRCVVHDFLPAFPETDIEHRPELLVPWSAVAGVEDVWPISQGHGLFSTLRQRQLEPPSTFDCNAPAPLLAEWFGLSVSDDDAARLAQDLSVPVSTYRNYEIDHSPERHVLHLDGFISFRGRPLRGVGTVFDGVGASLQLGVRATHYVSGERSENQGIFSSWVELEPVAEPATFSPPIARITLDAVPDDHGRSAVPRELELSRLTVPAADRSCWVKMTSTGDASGSRPKGATTVPCQARELEIVLAVLLGAQSPGVRRNTELGGPIHPPSRSPAGPSQRMSPGSIGLLGPVSAFRLEQSAGPRLLRFEYERHEQRQVASGVIVLLTGSAGRD